MLRAVKFPGVSLPVPLPRLLPLTIATMAFLLLVKSAELVRAAAPEGAAAPAEAKAADAKPMEAAPPAEAPKPEAGKMEGDKPEASKAEGDKPEAGKPEEGKAAGEGAKAAAMAKPLTGNAAAAAIAPPMEPPISKSERDLLLDLRKRREELDQREAAIRQHESLLAAAEARLSTRINELSGLQKRLESLETARKEHDEANWRGLVKLYESMKPKDAATIFNDLDLPVLLPVLDRMKESKAAPVLAAMSPDRARLVTAELAQMRAAANAVPPAAPAPAGAGKNTAPPGKPAGG